MEMNKKFFLIQCLISFYLFSLCLDISLLVGFYFCLFNFFFFTKLGASNDVPNKVAKISSLFYVLFG